MATRLVNGERVDLTAQEVAERDTEERKAAEALAAKTQKRAEKDTARAAALSAVIERFGITEEQFKDAVKAAFDA